jgi:hypothetical protein
MKDFYDVAVLARDFAEERGSHEVDEFKRRSDRSARVQRVARPFPTASGSRAITPRIRI